MEVNLELESLDRRAPYKNTLHWSGVDLEKRENDPYTQLYI